MRDPQRIERVLETIRQAWEQVPDWRLGQLFVNAVGPRDPCPELFYVEDDQLEQLIVRMMGDGR